MPDPLTILNTELDKRFIIALATVCIGLGLTIARSTGPSASTKTGADGLRTSA